MSELDVVRICALLHDVGKLECWANRKPWSEHIHWTYKIVKECLGETYALISMRHHAGMSYPSEYHPQSELEKIICLADNFSSGADRREEPERGAPFPKPPICLTHVLSDGTVARSSFDEAKLAYVSTVLRQKMKEIGVSFVERPKEAYSKIFELLEVSELREIPADTRKPINDVSLWSHSKLTAAFATCIFIDGGYRGDNPQKYEFAILSGDADRISSYVNVSRRLPDLNARSERIKKATKAVVEALSYMLGPECVIYAAGGSFVALSPKGRAEEALVKAKETFESCMGRLVTITVNRILVNGEEIVDGFGRVWEKAQLEMRFKKGERELPVPNPVEEGVDACDVCHSRPWAYEDKLKILRVDAAPRPERLCEFCWQLRREGRGVELDSLKKETNFVALIKADGDDMGKVLRGDLFAKLDKANTPSRLSTLSDLIGGACEGKLKEVVRKYGGECVFAGGDDVLAFVPGEKALEASKNIAEVFRDEMAGECSMSVGVAIFRYDLPVYVGMETASYLLKRAKDCGKNRIAYAIVGGSGVTLSELDEYVKPRTWDELNELLKIVKFMGESSVASSQIRRVAGLASEGSKKPEFLVKSEALIKHLMGKGIISWREGERLLGFLKTGLLHEAFLIYNLFKGI
ncbi:MAG: type III-B CRISPR-associated protein Cas10/Cmr2 [Candidatus Bathyarchaeales archaeon]